MPMMSLCLLEGYAYYVVQSSARAKTEISCAYVAASHAHSCKNLNRASTVLFKAVTTSFKYHSLVAIVG